MRPFVLRTSGGNCVMAIEFNCPHCLTSYRLKDEFAGKKATCKNQSCRKVLVVPQPGGSIGPTIAELGGIAPEANGRKDDTPLPKNQDDIEAAALAALTEAPKEEKAAADQAIPVTCDYCGHQWTEPLAKAGKNVLCPDPECRRQVKIPVPKEKKADDWRDAASRPSLAKENFEKPADVVDAQAKVVSKEAWEKGGGAEQYLEPIPLKRKIFFGLLIATPIIALIAGIAYFWQSSWEEGQNQLMVDAEAQFNELGKSELSPAEQELYSAILNMAAGEYILRQGTVSAEELKMALDYFTKARDSLRVAATKDDPKRPSAGERNALACELALLTLELGGTAEQVQEESRYPWVPDIGAARDGRLRRRTFTVHEELQRTFQLLFSVEFDLKSSLLRRMARSLSHRGPDALALIDQIPVMLCPDPEKPEALAVLAVEIYRHDPSSTVARDMANDLKTRLSGPGGRSPTPASAETLWKILGIEKTPMIAAEPPKAPNQPVSEAARLAYVGLHLLRNQQTEALELARRPSNSSQSQNVEQLRGLTLYAEWAQDPGPAFDLAIPIIGRHKKGDFPPPPYVVYRLVQLAAGAGKTEQATKLADSLNDEGLKIWAKAEIVRESKPPIDASTVTAPDNPKDLRAGHAWSHLWLARNNTRISDDRSKETSAIATWQKGTLQPFGLAGIALGLRDQ